MAAIFCVHCAGLGTKLVREATVPDLSKLTLTINVYGNYIRVYGSYALHSLALVQETKATFTICRERKGILI